MGDAGKPPPRFQLLAQLPSATRYCRTGELVVLPLTSNVDSLYPGEAMLVINGKPARVSDDQIRSLDKSRLQSRIATLSPDELAAVDEAIRITRALQP